MRIWMNALPLLVVVLVGCNSLAVISKPESIAAVGKILPTDAYTEISARIVPIGNCSFPNGTPLVRNDLLGMIGVHVTPINDTPFFLPLVPILGEACLNGKDFRIQRLIPVNPNDAQVRLVITSGFDRQLTDLSLNAAKVASTLATGGAAETLTNLAAIAATPGMDALIRHLSQAGGEQVSQNISITDPWASHVIPAYGLEYGAFQSRREAVNAYQARNEDKLFEIHIQKTPVPSQFWRNYPTAPEPDRNAVLNRVVQTAGTNTGQTLYGYTATKLQYGFDKSDRCSEWQQISSDFNLTTIDAVLFYRTMLRNGDSSATWMPEARVLDSCKLPKQVETSWRRMFPSDWVRVSVELPKNAAATEVWKREIAPLLDQASDALTATKNKRERWTEYFARLDSGHNSIEIEGKESLSTEKIPSEEVLVALSSLPVPNIKRIGCYSPTEANTGGELYFVEDPVSAPTFWYLEIKKNADGSKATTIKTKGVTGLRNFVTVGYEYDPLAACTAIRGLIRGYVGN